MPRDDLTKITSDGTMWNELRNWPQFGNDKTQ